MLLMLILMATATVTAILAISVHISVMLFINVVHDIYLWYENLPSGQHRWSTQLRWPWKVSISKKTIWILQNTRAPMCYVVWEICRIKEIAISYIKKRKSKGKCTYPVILMRKVWESGWPGCTGGRGRWPLVQVRVVRLVYHLGATHSSEPLNFGGFYVKLERQEKGSDH